MDQPTGKWTLSSSELAGKTWLHRLLVAGTRVACTAMTRGIVLWPDDVTSSAIRGIWERVAGQGISSLATFTHRRHRPHLSLVVAGDLPARAALEAVLPVPGASIHLEIESAGIFPRGVLFLGCVTNKDLVAEQRRVQAAIEPLAVDPWPYFRPGRWTPHITISMALDDRDLAMALPVVLERLPIHGVLDSGGLEDGSSGDSWSSLDDLDVSTE